jgi:dipeptidyl aminopeptidase/acylaminoacyl peptidase
MKICRFLALIILMSLTLAGHGQEKEKFNSQMLWEIKRPGEPQVSPDGKWSVFTLTEFDIEANSSSTDLFLMDNENGSLRQLTFSGKEGNPSWSPDGRRIAFTSRRDNSRAQVYVIDLQGGEARKITDLPVGVYGLKWFPDGMRLAFGANILPEYNGDWDRLRELQKKMAENKVSAKVTENTMYRFWDRWLTDGYYPRLFSLELETGKVVDLMPNTTNFFGMMGGVSYDISPDGNTIAVSMNTTEPPYERTNYDIFLLSTDGSGKMQSITSENPADDSNPVFSPDGRYILYGKQNIYHFYADRVVITLYDTRTQSHRELTGHTDLSCEQWFWADNSSMIYFLAEDRAKTSIFSIQIDGDRHSEVFRGGTNSGASFAGGRHLVFLHQTISSPPEIYKKDLRRGFLTKMTGFNDQIVDNVSWGKVEDVTYSGAYGAAVQMFIIYPPDYDPEKKYPLLMLIHGGPHGTFGDQFHFRWNAQLFATPGYIVAMPNFHGSTSFGQDFAISIHGQHADKPYRDVMKAADYLIERGLVDENRMAAAGGSYGGYLVSWIAGHTDRFACLINHAGVYDLHLQFASDYSGNRSYQYGGSPFQDFDRLNANNPSQFAHNFKTPMLVMHGELDYRVPVAHAFLVYGVYKAMGLDARLVYFPDENHWILKPQNSVFWYKEFFDWLERYLSPAQTIN